MITVVDARRNDMLQVPENHRRKFFYQASIYGMALKSTFRNQKKLVNFTMSCRDLAYLLEKAKRLKILWQTLITGANKTTGGLTVAVPSNKLNYHRKQFFKWRDLHKMHGTKFTETRASGEAFNYALQLVGYYRPVKHIYPAMRAQMAKMLLKGEGIKWEKLF